MNFETRLKNLIQERFCERRDWLHLGTDDCGAFDVGHDKHMGGPDHYWHIEGLHDIHFLFIEFGSSTNPSFNLWMCSQKPKIEDGKLKYGLLLVSHAWYSFPHPSNKLQKVKMDLIPPVFKPFERYEYILDVLKVVSEVEP